MSTTSSGRGTQALQLGGLVAAVVLAILLNVLAARHFKRWDWTADRRWSPSPATVETLRSLEQTVDVWVVAGSGEPLEKTLQPLLAAYRAESSRIEVHWIDPDRDAAALLDLQRRFGLEAGRTQDGRIATDAAVIVASGDGHYFLTPQDLYEQSDEVHVRPREERALTQAIRSVLGGVHTTLCFTVGHGELSLDPDRSDREGLQLASAGLRDLLDKSNYDLRSVDTSGPDTHERPGELLFVETGVRADVDPAKLVDDAGQPLWAPGPPGPTRELVRERDEHGATVDASLFEMPGRTWVVVTGPARARARDALAHPVQRPPLQLDPTALALVRFDGPLLVQHVPLFQEHGSLDVVGRRLQSVMLLLPPGNEGAVKAVFTYADDDAAAFAEVAFRDFTAEIARRKIARLAWLGVAKVERPDRRVFVTAPLPPQFVASLLYAGSAPMDLDGPPPAAR